MASFNLNNPLDFARATNSLGASVVSLFTSGGGTDWQIVESSYESGVTGVVNTFHTFINQYSYSGAVDQITDKGGRRKAKFVFPYLDGQLTEDMGRRAETFDINIVLFGGTYITAFNNLLNSLNEKVPGILQHPVRGRINCAMEDYEIIHEEKSRKAIAIKLTMIEHSLGGIVLQTRIDSSVNGKMNALTSFFANNSAQIAKIQGNINAAQSLKNTLIQGANAVSVAFVGLVTNMNATFNQGSNIPALLPTQLGGLLDTSSGTVVSSSTSIALSPSDPFSNLPASLVGTPLQQALAFSHVQNLVQAVRDMITSQITALETSINGQGALSFFDDIINLRQTANDIQGAYNAGQQSSQFRLIKYITPRLMSVREVAFANGLSPDDGVQVAYLNPNLDSLNYIPANTSLQVAVQT